jgi:hypothetical protein
MIKVSDFIAKYLKEKHHIDQVFILHFAVKIMINISSVQ